MDVVTIKVMIVFNFGTERSSKEEGAQEEITEFGNFVFLDLSGGI